MATNTSPILAIVWVLLLAAVASASIEEVCRKASAAGTIDQRTCINVLRSAPGAASADDRGLAIIAGNMGAAHAQATLSKINNMLRSAGPAVKAPLKDCQELYGDAVDGMKNAVSSARGNRYNDANVSFSAVMDDASTCEGGFSEKNVASPLTAEDSKLLILGTIGAAITSST